MNSGACGAANRRWGALNMETKAEVVPLPTMPSQCPTLRDWRDLVLASSQLECAARVGLTQARIQSVECGRLMPRRKQWPRLMNAFQQPDASKPQLTEHEFYRMLTTARRRFVAARNRAAELRLRPAPLFAAAVALQRAEFLEMIPNAALNGLVTRQVS